MFASKKGPPDGGYGWVVVIAAAIGLSLLVGLNRVAGFTYVEIIQTHGTTRAETSIIFMTARLITFASTPIASKLSIKYPYSRLTIIGGVLLFLSIFLSAFAVNLWQLVLTYGVLLGLGAPLLMTPGLLAINTYFKKRRALALSVYFTIGGASGLVIPFIYEILLDKYLLGGAFLIYSALCLNIWPCGLLIRQPNWPLPVRPRTRLPSTICTDEIDPCLKLENGVPVSRKSIKIKPIFQRMIITFRNDITIFKDPVFVILWVSRIFITSSLLNMLQFIPDFVENDLDLGLSSKDIAILLSMTSIGDVVARILTGTVIDKLPWHMKYTYATLSAAVGVLIFVFLTVTSFVLLVAVHVIFGLLLGVLVVMQFILEADLMGLEKTPLSHGITQASGGVGSVIMMFVVGYFRDITGNYTIGFSIMGFSAILAGLVWVFQPCCPRRIQPQPSIEKFPETDVCLDAV